MHCLPADLAEKPARRAAALAFKSFKNSTQNAACFGVSLPLGFLGLRYFGISPTPSCYATAIPMSAFCAAFAARRFLARWRRERSVGVMARL